MRRIRKTLVALFVSVTLGVVVVAPAGAAYGLVRYESSAWIWYQPRGWSAAQGPAGIDISSPGARELVSHGFSGTAMPVTSDEVMSYIRSNSNPRLLRFKTLRRSAPKTVGNIRRVTYDWRAVRGDTRKSIRGFSQVDVFTGPYGFYYSGYVAPASRWASERGMLRYMWKNARYLPQGPTGGLDF